MGLHTGEPEVGERRYVGMGVHKAARIGAAGHGGQVLLSSTTRELVEDELPPGVTVRDLGERRLKDVERPERLFQLDIAGLRSDFAALKTLDVELKRRRRRLYAGAALIGVLAAAIAIPVFALGQGSSGGAPDVAPNSLAIIDPAVNKVVGSVPNVGVTPSGVVFGEGSIWVANLDGETVSRVDPATRTLRGTISIDATPTGLAVGAGSVWTANGLLGTVSRIDPGVATVAATIPDVASRSNGAAIAVGEEGIWFVSAISTVARIDPARDRVRTSGIAGLEPSAVAVGDGSVWVANSGDNTVSRINPRTAGVVRTISVGLRPRGIAVGGDSVWVSDQGSNLVTRIDSASGSVDTIGLGAVWVANSDDGTVSRIDPTTGAVKTIEVGGRPSGVAVGSGRVWVTVQAPLATSGTRG
jgi:serine/threonine-protein kinase